MNDEWLEKHGLELADEDAPVKICWIDLETTGLDVDKDVILEVGVILTDAWGNPIEDAHYHSLVFEPSDHYRERMKLENMGTFVHEMHTKSGLFDELKTGKPKSVNKVQTDILQLLSDFDVEPRTVYLGGNSVHFDAQMLHHYAFNLLQFLHYRQANVSTFKIVAQMLNPGLYANMLEHALRPFETHRSMDDLGDSLNEYKCYIDNFLWTADDGI